MKLSMWILADTLEKYHPRVDIKANLLEIETVRLFSADVVMNQKTVYIGRMRDLFQNGSGNVICTHNNDMIILDTEDLDEVLNHILNVIELYNAWSTKMFELLSSGAMLQDLFDASAEIIKEPVFLLDAGYRLLARHQAYGIGDVDEVWDATLINENVPVDYLLQINQHYPERLQNKGIFYLSSNEFFPKSCYNYNFFSQKNWAGCAILVLKNTPEKMATKDIFNLFCSYLQRWFESHVQEQQSVLLDSLLQQTISDAKADTMMLKRQLRLYGWNESDELMLMKLDTPFQSFNIHTYLCRTLNMNLPSVYAVIKDMSVCLLCNLTMLPLEKLIQELKPRLSGSRYYGMAGQKMTFEDSFYRHYEYVAYMSEYCEKQPGNIYTGEQYVLQYLFHEMQKTVIDEARHPALRQLKQYDDAHHTELYKTLDVYLNHERGLNQTAQALGLHRNSLLYRLKRIEQLTGVNLEDAQVRLHLMLSYKL